MSQIEWIKAVEEGAVEWSAHALKTMFERDISREAVKHVIRTGEVIETYQEDRPFPSTLILGFWKNKPLHAVTAYDTAGSRLYIITAYVPDERHFQPDWKVRRIK